MVHGPETLSLHTNSSILFLPPRPVSSRVYQTDAKSAHESLLEALDALTEQTCHDLLLGPDGASSGATHSASLLWNGLHAVRGAFRSAMASGTSGASHDATGFSAEVREMLHLSFPKMNRSVRSVDVPRLVLFLFGERATNESS